MGLRNEWATFTGFEATLTAHCESDVNFVDPRWAWKSHIFMFPLHNATIKLTHGFLLGIPTLLSLDTFKSRNRRPYGHRISSYVFASLGNLYGTNKHFIFFTLINFSFSKIISGSWRVF